MAELRRLYPLSTPLGDWIPLDVWRVHGLGRIDFTITSQALLIPTDVEILILRATQECIVKLAAAVVTVPASLTYVADEIMIPIGVYVIIDKNEATELRAIRISADGTLWINGLRAWQDTKKAVQFNRA